MRVAEHRVYHAGEIGVQQLAGDRELAERRARLIGNRIGGGAREFLLDQEALAVAATAPDHTLWASLWCGPPGFLHCDEPGECVTVDSALDRAGLDDPVRSIARPGAFLGMLAIDLTTRQRLRINGIVSRADTHGLDIGVREAFGNCPKYIQRREPSERVLTSRSTSVHTGSALDADRIRFVTQADTLFVASIHPERGVDVSHRGGEPGFVRVDDERTLRIPDYAGNGMYQTLGNFAADSRAGVAMIDFDRGRVLSMSGSAVGIFGRDDPRHPTGGTGRYWTFTISRWTEFALNSMTSWTLVERSPFNPSSGAR